MDPQVAPIDESCVLIDGPWAHRFISANGSRFHVVEAGTGPLVLFLHGFPEFWWAWHQQLRAIADAGYRAVAVDMRGYGATDKPPRGYDGYTMAADVTGLIRALGERSATLVGSGYGGMMAWTTAAFHPKMVRSPDRLRRRASAAAARRAAHRPARPVGLGDAGAQIPDAAVRARGHPQRCRADRRVPARVGRPALGEQRRTSPTTSASAAPRCRSRRPRSARWRPTGGRSGRCCGCTAIGSSSCCSSRSSRRRCNCTAPIDPAVLPRTAQGSSRYVIARYEWRLLDGVGHFPHVEVPELVTGAILEWLKSHDRVRRGTRARR